MIPKHNLARLAGALTAGLLFPFAFAPYGHSWLVFPIFAGLFALWMTSTPRQAAATGFIFGMGMFGYGVWWIQVSVHQFGLPMYTFSVPVTAAFVLFISGYPALCGYFAMRVPVLNDTLRILLVFPSLWTLSEIARGSLLTGFPWLLAGYSQIDTPLSSLAPVLGAYGVTLVITTLAACLTLLVTQPKLAKIIATVGLCLLAGLVFLVRDVVWTTPSKPPQTAALVQGAVPQAVKWSRAYRQPSIDLYTALSEPYWGDGIIVWPETAIPAFASEVPDTMKVLHQQAADSGTRLLIGMPTRPPDTSDYFNSVVLFGNRTAQYDKIHLVPFGEYLPFDRWLRPVTNFLKVPMSDFSAGDVRQTALDAGGLMIGLSICYEDAYASEVRRALPTAEVLINVSNDAWFGDSIAPHQHLQIARMRALEAGRDLLRATNTGISAIIDFRGKVVGRSKQFVPDVVAGEFIPRQGVTPAIQYGIWPVAGYIVLATISSCLRRRRKPLQW